MWNIIKKWLMAVRRFVLELVQHITGERRTITVEQEQEQKQEPKVEYVLRAEKLSTPNTWKIQSEKIVDGTHSKLPWNITQEGDAKDLVQTRKVNENDLTVTENLNPHNTSKQYTIKVAQTESNKEIEVTRGTIEGQNYDFREQDHSTTNPADKSVKYIIYSRATGVDSKKVTALKPEVTLSGEGAKYLEVKITDDPSTSKGMYNILLTPKNAPNTPLKYTVVMKQPITGRTINKDGSVGEEKPVKREVTIRVIQKVLTPPKLGEMENDGSLLPCLSHYSDAHQRIVYPSNVILECDENMDGVVVDYQVSAMHAAESIFGIDIDPGQPLGFGDKKIDFFCDLPKSESLNCTGKAERIGTPREQIRALHINYDKTNTPGRKFILAKTQYE